jgi:hypothetical protein
MSSVKAKGAMDMRVPTFTLAACVLTLSQPASAEIIDLTFQGYGYDLSGSIEYDTSQAPFDTFDATEPFFDGASHFVINSPMTITYNGKVETFPVNDMDVSSTVPASSFQSSIVSLTPTDANDDIVEGYELVLYNMGSPLSSYTSMPSSIDANYFSALYYQSPNEPAQVIPITATFTAVTPTPEMPAWVSMVLGLGLVGGVVWWGRRRMPFNALALMSV